MFVLTNKTIEKLKHDLVREGLVDIDGLSFAHEKAQKNGTNLAVELVKEQIISEKKLLQFIEKKLHIPFVDLADYTPDISCLDYVSAQDATKNNIFPLFKIEDVLTIAMADPLDLFTINTLFENSNISVEPVVCSEASIKKAIDEYYFDKQSKILTTWQDILFSDNITDESLQAAIYAIFDEALIRKYDYMVFESSSTGLNLFFNKKPVSFIPNILVHKFIYELKNIVGLDNEEDNIAQSIKFKYKNNSFGVAILPTKFGIRITVTKNCNLKTITDYGFSIKKINELAKKHGFIGVCAKNHKDALYLIYTLAEHFSKDYNVVIIEDNSKCELNGVTQLEFQKNTAIEFDEILRQVGFHNFDMIFLEKIYTEEQAQKLKLLSKEFVVFASINEEISSIPDTILYSNGSIK